MHASCMHSVGRVVSSRAGTPRRANCTPMPASRRVSLTALMWRPSFVARVSRHYEYVRQTALDHGMRQLDLTMPHFAATCIDASKDGLTKQRCGYPTRDWFSRWPQLASDESFREEFIQRVKNRHVEKLGYCLFTVKWPRVSRHATRYNPRSASVPLPFPHGLPGAPFARGASISRLTPALILVRTLDSGHVSQVLEVTCDWSPAQVQRAQPTSNVKGPCAVCFESSKPLIALTPCGHLACVSCAQRFRMQACPFCRERVVGIQSLFQAADQP